MIWCRSAVVLAVGVGLLACGQARAAVPTVAGQARAAVPTVAGQARAAVVVPVYVNAAHGGEYYGATSTASPGGGILQDVADPTVAGQLVCASAWLRTQFPAVGASGDFALWLTGDTTPESGRTHYGGLGNLSDWTQVHTCVEATSDHSTLRIQFYPDPGSPTVDMDDVDVNESLAANGGFEQGAGPWVAYPGTNTAFTVDRNATALSGGAYAATSNTSPGGGIYQDVSLITSPGDLVCASAWLRNDGSGTGAAGSFDLWLRGETAIDNGSVSYGGLGDGSDWKEVHTCVEATGNHNSLRIQFYVNGSAVDIDDVDVNESLAANGGFETGTGPWGTYPGSDTTYNVLASGLVHGSPSPVQTTPVPTPLPRPRGRHALRVRIVLSWTWNHGVTRLDKVKIVGRVPRGAQLTLRCSGRGCPRLAASSAAGRRGLRRLLRAWTGRRFHAGDHLQVALTAPGFAPVRGVVEFRFGKVPLIKSPKSRKRHPSPRKSRSRRRRRTGRSAASREERPK